jgi:hypothetical protein
MKIVFSRESIKGESIEMVFRFSKTPTPAASLVLKLAAYY